MLRAFEWECSEYDLFMAVINWATKSLEEKRMEASDENIKAEIGGCVYDIRIPLMTPKQFATVFERYTSLLPLREIMDILHFVVDGRELSVASAFTTSPRIVGDKKEKMVFRYCPKIYSSSFASLTPKTDNHVMIKLNAISFVYPSFDIDTSKKLFVRLFGQTNTFSSEVCLKIKNERMIATFERPFILKGNEFFVMYFDSGIMDSFSKLYLHYEKVTLSLSKEETN